VEENTRINFFFSVKAQKMQRFFAVYKLLFLTLQLFECHQEDEMLGEFCRARHFYCNGHKK
jgi:hypothetical protein